MIERHHLLIMREIDRQGSLTAAAQALHLTQSAVSHSIKKLEHQLGTALWVKEGRKLVFTQAGQFLLDEACRLLPQLERVDDILEEYASGDKGTLRIGMECHPCYRWLLTVVQPFLEQWPGVDVDVKQKFQFGGMAALFNQDIDMLVTPDPLFHQGIQFFPVFDYEQVLVINEAHPFAHKDYIEAEDLSDQTLYTYPVKPERLDIFNQFLQPAGCQPLKHKTLEATEILLQMVATNRGVSTLPRWLVEQYQDTLPIRAVRLGKEGVMKQIHLGLRCQQTPSQFMEAFLELARRN